MIMRLQSLQDGVPQAVELESYCQALQSNEQFACNHTRRAFAGADVAAAKFMGSLTPMAAAEG